MFIDLYYSAKAVEHWHNRRAAGLKALHGHSQPTCVVCDKSDGKVYTFTNHVPTGQPSTDSFRDNQKIANIDKNNLIWFEDHLGKSDGEYFKDWPLDLNSAAGWLVRNAYKAHYGNPFPPLPSARVEVKSPTPEIS